MRDELCHSRRQGRLLLSRMSTNAKWEERAYCGCTRRPLLVVTQLVECPDNFQEGVGGRLPDALVVVRQQLNQLQGALFNVWQEMIPGGRENGANCVSCDLLFNSNGAVDFKHLV